MKSDTYLADMDEDDLRTLVEKLTEERDEAREERDEALADLVDVEDFRAAAVAYLEHVRELPLFALDGNIDNWRMYEAQLRADLVGALNVGSAQAGLLCMPVRRAG